MMKKTKVFVRLPNIAGVHFDGVENIVIESRQIVKKEIDDFIKYCKKDAKGTAVRVILGEWGEGKTEAYYRFIFPSVVKNNDYAFFVSASTLANCYDDEKTLALMNTTPLTALKLLIAIFKGIKEEIKHTVIRGEIEEYENYRMQVLNRIPSAEEYNDAGDFMEDVLDNLLGREKTKTIFIFIDEFEELLLNRKALRSIVSGIKETINGLYGLIHENGKYEGMVHFFISCTPDAYYKLQIHEDTSLIHGGLARRAKVIEFPEIGKKEGIDFLYELLKYSYDNKLPDPLPIQNLGVFNLLLKISQHNLGNLVSLYADVLNSVRENDYLHVLDYDHLLHFLERGQIFIYGGQTSCIERDTYYRITRCLKDQKIKEVGELCAMLFNLHIGELKPFNIDELEKRTKRNKKQIQNAINIINENIRIKEKIDKTIIKVSPLKDGKTLEDVLEFFDEYVEIDKMKNEKIICIENHSEYLNDFIDRIVHYDYDEGNIVSKIFLPVDEIDIRIFFGGEISHEKSIELRNALRKFRSEEIYYLASDAILAQIFPTPVPKGLEFITNRELRLKLWREVSCDLTGEYDRHMPKAFFKFLEEADLYDFIEKRDRDGYSIVQLMDKKTETTLRALFYPVNGDVKREDIENVSNILNTDRKIHLAILLRTGEITIGAQQKISNKEIGKEGKYSLLDIHIHPTLAKKILCSYRAVIETRKEGFDDQRFKAVCREIITQELMFDTKLFDWVKEQEIRGLVIVQISTSARSLKEFSDALKFYINYIDEANSPEDVFRKNMNEILKFRKYGTKTGFLPSDFDSATKIAELSIDLHNNNFIQKIDGVYEVVTHPVENRMLQIIEKEKKITADDLRDYFIIKERKKKVLEDVFLNILEYKGKIQREKNFYRPIDPNDAYKYLKERYNKYKETIKRQEFKTFGHFYVVKERGDNLIMMKDFDNFLTKIFKKIESLKSSSQIDILLQRMSLLNRLMEQFNHEIEPAIKGASKRASEILKEVDNKMMGVKNILNFIADNSKKWLKFDFEIEHIKEFEKISEIYGYIKETYEKVYSQDELNKIKESIRDKRIFKFDCSLENAYYFNIKLFKLEQHRCSLNDKIEDINKFISRIKPIFEEINERENELNNKLKIREIPDRYKISNNVLNALKFTQIIGDIEIHSYKETGIKLREIEKSSKEIIENIKRRIDSIIDMVVGLDVLINKEKEFLSYLDESSDFERKIIEIFDTVEFKQQIESFKNILTEIKIEYDEFTKPFATKEKELKRKIDHLDKNFSTWRKSLENAKATFQSEWNSYKDKTTKFTKRVREMLVLLSKEHDVDLEDVNRKIRELLHKIEPSIDELVVKVSSLESLKKDIRELAMKIASEFITPDEAKVLDVLYSKRDEKIRWIQHEELLRELIEKYQMTEDDADEAIKKLISKKYILQGLSLSL